ncbi:hypothetical protein IF2G_01377 [Cordyceps javanica]|nr:hypothetical protein IF2G_01377 [Cordyceps javanica]
MNSPFRHSAIVSYKSTKTAISWPLGTLLPASFTTLNGHSTRQSTDSTYFYAQRSLTTHSCHRQPTDEALS